MHCVVVRGDAWPLLLSSCNTHKHVMLTWRIGMHLHDACATPWVVPNEVANRCRGAELARLKASPRSMPYVYPLTVEIPRFFTLSPVVYSSRIVGQKPRDCGSDGIAAS